MNKDHGEDTKMIVQHWTSVPVCHLAYCTVNSINKKEDFLFINIMEIFSFKLAYNIT